MAESKKTEGKEVRPWTIFVRGMGRFTFTDVGDGVMTSYKKMYLECVKTGIWATLFELKESSSGNAVFVVSMGDIQAVMDGR